MLSNSQRESVSEYHQGYSDQEEFYSESESRRVSHRWDSRRTSYQSSRRSFDIEAARGAVKAVRERTDQSPRESPQSSFEEVVVIVKSKREEVAPWMYYVAGLVGISLIALLCFASRFAGSESHAPSLVTETKNHLRRQARKVMPEMTQASLAEKPVKKDVVDMTKAEKKRHREWERTLAQPTFEGVGTPGNRPMFTGVAKTNPRQEVTESGDEILHFHTNHKIDPWLKLLNGPQAYLVNPEDCGRFYDYSTFKRNQKTDLPRKIIKLFEDDQSEVTQRLYLLCKAWTPLTKEDIAFRLGSLFNANEDLGEHETRFVHQAPASKLFKLLIHHPAFREFLSHKELRVIGKSCRSTIIQVKSRVLLRRGVDLKNYSDFNVGDTANFRAPGSNGDFRYGTVTKTDGKTRRDRGRATEVFCEDTGRKETTDGWEVSGRSRETRIVSDINWLSLSGAGDVMNNTHNGGQIPWPRATSGDHSLDRNIEPLSLSDPSLIDLVQESDKESWPHKVMKWGPKKQWWLSYNYGFGYEEDKSWPYAD
jgi:hypothetical protein